MKKLPALIMTNGVLAASAFAYAKGDTDGWYKSGSTIRLLTSQRQKLVFVPHSKSNLVALLDHLTREADSANAEEGDRRVPCVALLCKALRQERPKLEATMIPLAEDVAALVGDWAEGVENRSLLHEKFALPKVWGTPEKLDNAGRGMFLRIVTRGADLLKEDARRGRDQASRSM